MNLDQALQTFIIESRDLLSDMEAQLLHLERQPDDMDAINAVFRAAHTIKGSAGLFGLDAVVSFTHVVENLLDRIRDGEIRITPPLAALLLRSGDHMGELVTVIAEQGGESSADMQARETQLLGELEQHLGGSAAAAPAVAAVAETTAGAAACYHLSLRFGPDVLRNGMDPQSFIRYLESMGEVRTLTLVDDALPALADLDAENCYVGLEVDFESAAEIAAIDGVFDFVREGSRIHVLPADAGDNVWQALVAALPEPAERLRAIWQAAGSLPAERLSAVFGTAPAAAPAEAAPERAREGADRRQSLGRRAGDGQYVRVHADKLDQLINLVGELVIAGAGASLMAQRSVMREAINTVTRLVEEIRDSALKLRMVEIGETFSKFQRVVRDVSIELGKDIQLVITGAETELDKTVVEKIGDPLTHLVRNAMDHGIEAAAARLAAGKPEQGTVRLNAWHDSGSIVIEVADDGGGINRQKVLAKAVERGIVSAGQNLSDQEILQLIFEPGFSTAEQITNLSGRGVGMDVVKRNIQALRGSIDVDSVEGKGSSFRIRLPLTLAIIDGFLVSVGDANYVVPLDLVVECVELDVAGEGDGRNYINLRGEVLPYLRLCDLFEAGSEGGRRENIVVVQYAGQRAGIVVDELKGEFQTVIKPLGQIFRSLKGISGSTILGTGEVALILDVPALVQEAARQEDAAGARQAPRNAAPRAAV